MIKIVCEHGFYFFKSNLRGEIEEFSQAMNIDLIFKNDKYIFKELENAENYSIKGAQYLNEKSTMTYSGLVQDVFKANKFVFDLIEKKIKIIDSFPFLIKTKASLGYYVSNNLYQAGSLNSEGKRLTNFVCFYSLSTNEFSYEVLNFD